MVKHILTRAAVALPAIALAAFGVTSAASASTTTQNVSFFTGGSGRAHWLPPDHAAVILSVPDNSSYAGFSVHHFPAMLPASEPTFAYSETGAFSSSAPRLVFIMSNGDIAIEYSPVQGSDGSNLHWDIYGGPSGFHYNAGYATVQSLEAGNTVTQEFMVSDAYNGGHTDTVTSLIEDGQSLIG